MPRKPKHTLPPPNEWRQIKGESPEFRQAWDRTMEEVVLSCTNKKGGCPLEAIVNVAHQGFRQFYAQENWNPELVDRDMLRVYLMAAIHRLMSDNRLVSRVVKPRHKQLRKITAEYFMPVPVLEALAKSV